jgi:hypothetical protein
MYRVARDFELPQSRRASLLRRDIACHARGAEVWKWWARQGLNL